MCWRSAAGGPPLEVRSRGKPFERGPRGAIATDLGRAVLTDAAGILSRLEWLDRNLLKVRGGQVRDLTIVAGAFVGAVTLLLIVGPIVKLRASRRGEEFAFPDVPFGVFLAPGALLTLLWGDALIRWYVERAFSA